MDLVGLGQEDLMGLGGHGKSEAGVQQPTSSKIKNQEQMFGPVVQIPVRIPSSCIVGPGFDPQRWLPAPAPPSCRPREVTMMAQVLGPLPPAGEIWIEFYRKLNQIRHVTAPPPCFREMLPCSEQATPLNPIPKNGRLPKNQASNP